MKNTISTIPLEREHLCQGDIIASVDCSDSKNHKLGIIITADCDIAQSKFGQKLTYIPIVSVEDYVKTYWSNQKLENLKKSKLKWLLSEIDRYSLIIDPGSRPISASQLKDWLKTSEIDRIIDLLAIKDKNNASKIKVCCDFLFSEKNEYVGFEHIKQFMTDFGEIKSLTAEITSLLNPNKSPADVFFIPFIETFAEIGFIACLRVISSIDATAVHKSRILALEQGDPTAFYRVCRLVDPLKYLIVQRMVNLFSRIGLDEEIEIEHAIAAEIAINGIQEKMLASGGNN